MKSGLDAMPLFLLDDLLNKTPCILPVLQHVPIHASISIFLYVLHHLAVRLQTTKLFFLVNVFFYEID